MHRYEWSRDIESGAAATRKAPLVNERFLSNFFFGKKILLTRTPLIGESPPVFQRREQGTPHCILDYLTVGKEPVSLTHQRNRTLSISEEDYLGTVIRNFVLLQKYE